MRTRKTKVIKRLDGKLSRIKKSVREDKKKQRKLQRDIGALQERGRRLDHMIRKLSK